MRIEWVDESVLDTDPGLVRTLSVQPPRGTGRLRLIRIGEGGHRSICSPVAEPMYHGRVNWALEVLKIENKGRQNRRITIVPG